MEIPNFDSLSEQIRLEQDIESLRSMTLQILRCYELSIAIGHINTDEASQKVRVVLG